MQITYRTDITPAAAQIIELYNDSGLPRPTNDPGRMVEMYAHSDLVVSAWDGEKLVGVSRCITDWVWCCYLADLAIATNYKGAGIGRKLVEVTKEKLGPKVMIVLLSVPDAMEYYPKIGFEKVDYGFIMKRTV